MEKTQDSHKKVLNLPKAILLKKGSGLSGRKIAPKKEAKSLKREKEASRENIPVGKCIELPQLRKGGGDGVEVGSLGNTGSRAI